MEENKLYIVTAVTKKENGQMKMQEILTSPSIEFAQGYVKEYSGEGFCWYEEYFDYSPIEIMCPIREDIDQDNVKQIIEDSYLNDAIQDASEYD